MPFSGLHTIDRDNDDTARLDPVLNDRVMAVGWSLGGN